MVLWAPPARSPSPSSIQFWSGFIPVNKGGRIYPTLMFSDLSNSPSPSRSIQGILFLQANTLNFLHLRLPRLQSIVEKKFKVDTFEKKRNTEVSDVSLSLEWKTNFWNVSVNFFSYVIIIIITALLIANNNGLANRPSCRQELNYEDAAQRGRTVNILKAQSSHTNTGYRHIHKCYPLFSPSTTSEHSTTADGEKPLKPE